MDRIVINLQTGEKSLEAFTDEEIAQFQSIPQPLPLPDWTQFIRAMHSYFSIGLAHNYAVFNQIFNMLLILRDRSLEADGKNIEWQNFVYNFRLGKSAFTDEQLAEINEAMQSANIPLIE